MKCYQANRAVFRHDMLMAMDEAVMTHRGELLDQAADKIKQVIGNNCAYEKARASAPWEHAPDHCRLRAAPLSGKTSQPVSSGLCENN